jgi:hypothetical protein
MIARLLQLVLLTFAAVPFAFLPFLRLAIPIWIISSGGPLCVLLLLQLLLLLLLVQELRHFVVLLLLLRSIFRLIFILGLSGFVQLQVLAWLVLLPLCGLEVRLFLGGLRQVLLVEVFVAVVFQVDEALRLIAGLFIFATQFETWS